MAPPLPSTQRDRIALHLQQVLSTDITADVEGVASRTVRTVRRIRTRLRTWGHHTPPAQHGCTRITGVAARIGLRHDVGTQPWAEQDGMKEYLFDEWEIVVGQSTISRALKEMGMDRKGRRREGVEAGEGGAE